MTFAASLCAISAHAQAKPAATSLTATLCVPLDLVQNQFWDYPYPGGKMDKFRRAVGAFVVAQGDPRVQYRI